jgi:Tfp pilus assembly protein PilX
MGHMAKVRIVHVEHNDMPRNALGPTISAAHQGAAALLREREEALSTTEPGLREAESMCAPLPVRRKPVKPRARCGTTGDRSFWQGHRRAARISL